MEYNTDKFKYANKKAWYTCSAGQVLTRTGVKAKVLVYSRQLLVRILYDFLLETFDAKSRILFGDVYH